jgi:carbon monoxide dehydrogenase subunit G
MAKGSSKLEAPNMKIESKKVTIPANREAVFAYVSDLNNFKELLPADRISDWESNEDYCSFKIQGTATIDLHKESSTPHEKLELRGGEKAPFPIALHIFLDEDGGGTTVYQKVEAKVNPFLKMMVEKPLANLFDYIADRLKEKF